MKTTTNYGQFKLMSTNRTVSLGLVSRLKDSINKIGYNNSKPILVNEDFEIIDGQHRFQACMELGEPIIYCVQKTNGIDNDLIMLELNRNQAIWRLQEYLELFAKKGVKSHIEILDFHSRNKIGNISIAIRMCCKNNNSQSVAIRLGKNIPLNSKRQELVEFLKEFKPLSFYEKLAFVTACKMLLDKANTKQLKKLLSKKMIINQQATAAAYLKVFENIINKNSHEQNKISL